jgi:hypothetical protein
MKVRKNADDMANPLLMEYLGKKKGLRTRAPLQATILFHLRGTLMIRT